MGVVEAAKQQWFLASVLSAIMLARMYPPLGAKGGPLVPEITVKYLVVSLIFFISGVSLRFSELKAALGNVRLQVAVQGYSMAAVPLLMGLFCSVLPDALLSPGVKLGMMVLSCLPPPVSSAVILTKAAGGNEAAAVLSSTLGSFVGIALTPLLILMALGITASVPLTGIMANMTATVVLPLLLGQLVRAKYERAITRRGLPLSLISSCALLLIIYCTFCDTFSTRVDVTFGELLVTVVALTAFHVGSAALAFVAGRAAFHRRDVACLVFCASQKSLTLGIPLMNILFQGHPQLPLFSIPLLVFHPLQIVVGSLLVPPLRKWLDATAA